jgi:hypothetical protein
LDQFSGERRDLYIPDLDRGPRLLQRGVLLLESALRLLPGQALALKDSLSLLEGGSLLMELALHLLMCTLLLAKLLFHHGERGDFLLQISTQLLGLLGLLLGLGLPGPHPLGRGVV